MTWLRALALVFILTAGGNARADDAPTTKMRSRPMVATGITTIVLSCGQVAGFSLLAAFGDAMNHVGCGCFSCACGGGGETLIGLGISGAVLGAGGIAAGIVLVALGAKRVSAGTSFDARGLVLRF